MIIFPLLLAFAASGCDGDTVGAQDLGADSPDPAPQAMTKVTGKVIPPGDDSCNGTFPGFVEGDDVVIDMASIGGNAGKKTKKDIPCPEAAMWEEEGLLPIYIQKAEVNMETMKREVNPERSCKSAARIEAAMKSRYSGH